MHSPRLLYDLTVLGSGIRRNSSRAGIHRFALEVFRALAGRMGDSLAGYSSEPSDSFRALRVEGVAPGRWDGTALQRLASRVLMHTGKGFLYGICRSLSGLDEWVREPDTAMPISRLRQHDAWFSPHHIHFPRGVWHGAPGFRMATVFDLLPLDHPEWFAGPEAEKMGLFFQRAEAAGMHVATISQFVRDGILARGFPAERVHIISCAADRSVFRPRGAEEVARVLAGFGIPAGTPYFVVLNTIEPRKNVEAAFRFFTTACRSGLPDDVLLLVAGAKGWKQDDIENRAMNAGCGGRIRMLGYVPDDQLPGLLSGAHGLLYPTLGEGFGLPPLEAMSCGIPAVASNLDSLPEVVGKGGILLDPRNEDAWARALLELSGSPGLREDISRRALAEAGKFSWESSADALLEVLRSVGVGQRPVRAVAVP